jgi:RHS repeat-associated protein
VAATKPGMAAAYEYDLDDRRSAKSVTMGATAITRTLWSGTDELAEFDGVGALLRRVIPGPGIDDKVAYVAASGAVRYFHTDRLGSVVALSAANDNTISAGALSDQYAYSPFGESDAPLTGNPWRFTGRYLDAETGLYYYRARYYAPRLGQFLETDPIGTKDDPNLYLYVGLDPVNKTDPTGKCPSCAAFSEFLKEALKPASQDRRAPNVDQRTPSEMPKLSAPDAPVAVQVETGGTVSGRNLSATQAVGVARARNGDVVTTSRTSGGVTTDTAPDAQVSSTVTISNARTASDFGGKTNTASVTIVGGDVAVSIAATAGVADDGFVVKGVSVSVGGSTPDAEVSGTLTQDETRITPTAR